MQTMNLTFSPSALHDLTISWSSGVLSSSDGEFHFVENRPDTCEGVWKVTANWTSALEMPVFSFRISLEAYAIFCKSFFVESPFVRKIRKVVRKVKASLRNEFRTVAGLVCPEGNAEVQANLCLFSL